VTSTQLQKVNAKLLFLDITFWIHVAVLHLFSAVYKFSMESLLVEKKAELQRVSLKDLLDVADNG
jgi:hypothetical protein